MDKNINKSENILFVIIVFLLFSYAARSQTTYYVDATSGSDAAAGTSTGTAWKTADKVESVSFSAGDSVLFKRGETFRTLGVASGTSQDGNFSLDSGSASGDVYYGAYGTGDKPIIMAARNVSSTGDWSNISGNIWATSYSLPSASKAEDVANVIFNTTTYGTKVFNSVDLDTQGEFWYDGPNEQLRVYSTSNPGTFYTDIEFYGREILMDARSKNYITIENLELKYGNFGVSMGSSSNITVKNCDIKVIGGAIFTGTTRFGNGIELYGTGSDIIIEKNYIEDVYDAGITAQGGSESAWTVDTVIFRNNIVNKCHYSSEFFYQNAGTSTNNVQIVNNTFMNAGDDWGDQFGARPAEEDWEANLLSYGFSGTNTNWVVKNNIFYESKFAGVMINSASDPFEFDNNSYYESSGNGWQIGLYGTPTTYSFSSGFSSWKTAISDDANSIVTTPLFDGFIPTISSPTLDAGATLSNVADDYIGTTRPKGDAFDIGAYEYIPLASPTNYNQLKASMIRVGTGKGGAYLGTTKIKG